MFSIQGYGLTETCATATIMNVDENSTGWCIHIVKWLNLTSNLDIKRARMAHGLKQLYNGVQKVDYRFHILKKTITGRVGPPVQNSKLKLINWEEGNYRVTDKPHPRGEVILGGNQIAKGYYKLPEKTDEEFYTDDEGTRWFMTGDIGEVIVES